MLNGSVDSFGRAVQGLWLLFKILFKIKDRQETDYIQHYIMMWDSNLRPLSSKEYDYWMIHNLPYGWTII